MRMIPGNISIDVSEMPLYNEVFQPVLSCSSAVTTGFTGAEFGLQFSKPRGDESFSLPNNIGDLATEIEGTSIPRGWTSSW